MEKEIDRIEAMIIMGKYEIPKMVFDKVMQEGIQEGRKQEQERIMRIIRDTGYIRNMSKLTLYKKIFLKEKLQKEIDND